MYQCVVGRKCASPRCRKYIERRHKQPVLTGLTVGMVAIGKVHDLSRADFHDMVCEAKRLRRGRLCLCSHHTHCGKLIYGRGVLCAKGFARESIS